MCIYVNKEANFKKKLCKICNFSIQLPFAKEEKTSPTGLTGRWFMCTGKQKADQVPCFFNLFPSIAFLPVNFRISFWFEKDAVTTG